MIMPEGSDPNSGVGTGAFTIESFEPGVRTLAKRSPNYWPEGCGHADSVELLVINDQAARTSAPQTGAIHVLNRVDPKTVSLLERGPHVQNIAVTRDEPQSVVVGHNGHVSAVLGDSRYQK